MAQNKPTSSEESTSEEKIFEKGWLEITKKEFLFGCIGLPVFLGIISAIIAPYFTLWGPIEDVNQPKLMTPKVEENE
jgi:hypothetical protein